MIEIGTAISSLAALKTIFEGAVAVRDDTKLMEVKLAFQQQLFEVQNAMLAMQGAYAKLLEEKREIEDANRRSQQFETEMQGHALFEPAPGVFVYALQPSDGSRPKLPYFCHPCYKARKQSILSYEAAISASQPAALHCPEQAAHRVELPRRWRREHLINGLPSGEHTE